MPLVESVEMAPAVPALSSMPAGACWMLAGASKAVVGTCGTLWSEAARSSAVASPELLSAAPQATTSTVMGARAPAFCQRLNVRAAMSQSPSSVESPSHHGPAHVTALLRVLLLWPTSLQR
ncbi:hypothetical protein ASD11_13175 [Aeromicrobium sp. Root495]|nr:hypothetical protein ASD11_13175 [Aeromicrobium sp. Root495]